jgi:hypothetical protein
MLLSFPFAEAVRLQKFTARCKNIMGTRILHGFGGMLQAQRSPICHLFQDVTGNGTKAVEGNLRGDYEPSLCSPMPCIAFRELK